MGEPVNKPLIIGAIGIFAVALLHFIMPSLGSDAYVFFGAPELKPLADSGSSLPAIVTYGLAVVFTLLGLVELSASGAIPHKRFVRSISWIVAIVFIVRGLVLLVELYYLFTGSLNQSQMPFFSGIALLIGILLFVGLRAKS